jgi:hypothetical protein
VLNRAQHHKKHQLHLAIHPLGTISGVSNFDSDDDVDFNEPQLYNDALSRFNLPAFSPYSATRPAMNMLPHTCQPPPSPPDSDKSSWLATDSRLSHAAKVIDGRLIRQNEYFIPGNDIDGGVLAAELPLYLGNDASQRQGTCEDRETGRLVHGYFITAYRALTTAMLDDIKADSARREQEMAQNQRTASHTDCTTDQKMQQWRDVLTPPSGSIYET